MFSYRETNIFLNHLAKECLINTILIHWFPLIFSGLAKNKIDMQGLLWRVKTAINVLQYFSFGACVFQWGLLVTFVSPVDINIVFSIGIGNSSLKTLTSLIHLLLISEMEIILKTSIGPINSKRTPQKALSLGGSSLGGEFRNAWT